jgi:hypothetical protein
METKKSTIWMAAATVLVLIIISVLFLKANKVESPTQEIDQQEQATYDRTIDIKHQYKDGKHIFAGVVEVPTPCHQANLAIVGGEIAQLNFSIVDSGEICAQVISDANFYAEFEGPENQLFVANLNGEPVNLNKFEVDADLDINSIDIFNKG